MKLRLFVDESYHKDHYYIAGILADDRAESELNRRLNGFAASLAEELGLESLPEFHAHELMNAQGDWISLEKDASKRIAILRRLAIEVAESGALAIVEGVDVDRLNARYKYPDSPYEIALRHMLERVDDRCNRRGNDCQVYADMIDRKEDFVEAIAGYTRVGTPGYRSSKLTRIEQPINYIDSKDNYGIQAADLVAYVVRRDREHKTGSKSAIRANRRIRKILDPIIWHERKWIP